MDGQASGGTEMRIGILGSGLMGSKLGTILARAGHDVVFSYSRSRKKLEKVAKETPAAALSAARYIEPFSLLLAEIAYSGTAGPELVYRFERLPAGAS